MKKGAREMIKRALLELERRVADLEADLAPPLGIPGGIGHTQRRIEDAIEDTSLESDLVNTLYQGGSITNQEARLVYRFDDCNPLNEVDIFKGFCTTAHGQYRMDQRGISVRVLEGFFFNLERYLEKNRGVPALQGLARGVFEGGGVVKWTDPYSNNLSVVFERQGEIAKIITAYYKDKEDPVYKEPTPSYMRSRGRRRG